MVEEPQAPRDGVWIEVPCPHLDWKEVLKIRNFFSFFSQKGDPVQSYALVLRLFHTH